MRTPCPRPRRNAAATRVAATGAVAAVAAALTALALSDPGARAGAASSSPSAQAEYQAALKAVDSESGVHFTSSATQGKITIDVEGDTGASSGQQKLVVHNGSLAERMSALVVGRTGYVNGNSDALHHVIGLGSAQSKKYAGTWLSFPTSNNGLNELVNGLLNSQVPGELQMRGPYRYGTPTTVNGQRVLAIRGQQMTQSGSAVATILYVAAHGKPLPLQEVTDPGSDGGSSSSIRGTVTLSNWGQAVAQHAPAHSVSLLKLVPASSGASGPSG